MARKASSAAAGIALGRLIIKAFRNRKKKKAAHARDAHKATRAAEKAKLQSDRAAQRDAHKAQRAAEKAKAANKTSWTHEKHMYHHERAMYHANRTNDPARKSKYLEYAVHHLTQARKYE
jgi:FtsZ-interacting cell division protein ZipA